jgi:hypothetical protein
MSISHQMKQPLHVMILTIPNVTSSNQRRSHPKKMAIKRMVDGFWNAELG